MLFRALLCLLVVCPVFGAQKEILFDGEKLVIPDLPGLKFVDPKEEWYQERAEIFADSRQFYAVLHGHEDDFCLQLFVTRDKETKAGAVTLPKKFKNDHGYVKGVKHLTDRLWIFQTTTDPYMLSAHMLCSGKVVKCMLLRFRNENEKNKKMLSTTEEDERRFLAWCQAVVAANPMLTPEQQKTADKTDLIDTILALIFSAAILYYLYFKLREARTKTQTPWATGKPNGF